MHRQTHKQKKHYTEVKMLKPSPFTRDRHNTRVVAVVILFFRFIFDNKKGQEILWDTTNIIEQCRSLYDTKGNKN